MHYGLLFLLLSYRFSKNKIDRFAVITLCHPLKNRNGIVKVSNQSNISKYQSLRQRTEVPSARLREIMAALLLLKPRRRPSVLLTVLLQQPPRVPTLSSAPLLPSRLPATGNLSGEAKAPAALLLLQLKRSALSSASVGKR